MLCRGLEDSFHEIKKAACAALADLAPRVPPAALQPHSERLLQVSEGVCMGGGYAWSIWMDG